ncbi:hypothetical protein BpHYR1_036624 [Brachionus plicatilis]|uniref:Uncharacterized protein n=1 Tax=Brachionus plicatilis TaxID=10195 RepID=A0A3M7RTP3_BRAPC|nr:hypothetical protein BpHYR1_036624 [Brachionus plicatilis]
MLETLRCTDDMRIIGGSQKAATPQFLLTFHAISNSARSVQIILAFIFNFLKKTTFYLSFFAISFFYEKFENIFITE